MLQLRHGLPPFVLTQWKAASTEDADFLFPTGSCMQARSDSDRAASNGLKLSIRLSSGEDSMTSGGWLVLAGALLELPPLAAGLLEPPLAEVFELLDEQAARPAARSVTAPAVSTLLPGILLIVNSDLSSRITAISRRSVVFTG